MKKVPQDTFHRGFPQEVKVNIFKLFIDDIIDALSCGGFLYIYFRQCHSFGLLGTRIPHWTI